MICYGCNLPVATLEVVHYRSVKGVAVLCGVCSRGRRLTTGEEELFKDRVKKLLMCSP